MALGLEEVRKDCVDQSHQGGYFRVDSDDAFALTYVLYQPGSPYDHYLSIREAAGLIPEADGNGVPKGDPHVLASAATGGPCHNGVLLPGSMTSCNFTQIG
ncbi:hypothetical protein ACLMJK_002517 [Lecanora helva]